MPWEDLPSIQCITIKQDEGIKTSVRGKVDTKNHKWQSRLYSFWSKSIVGSLCVPGTGTPAQRSWLLGPSLSSGHSEPGTQHAQCLSARVFSFGFCWFVSVGESRSALWFLNCLTDPQEAPDPFRLSEAQTILIITQRPYLSFLFCWCVPWQCRQWWVRSLAPYHKSRQ